MAEQWSENCGIPAEWANCSAVQSHQYQLKTKAPDSQQTNLLEGRVTASWMSTETVKNDHILSVIMVN